MYEFAAFMVMGAYGCSMKEVEAKDFTVPGIDDKTTPVSVRLLPKKPGTHLSEVPNDEWSLHISSNFNISRTEWTALAVECENSGYNTNVSENGIAVW